MVTEKQKHNSRGYNAIYSTLKSFLNERTVFFKLLIFRVICTLRQKLLLRCCAIFMNA